MKSSMALIDKTWNPVSNHEVVLKWLRAERHTPFAVTHFPSVVLLGAIQSIASLLDIPNLNDEAENLSRQRLLCTIRGALIQHIPFTATWYNVEFLTDGELSELHAINHHEWVSDGDRNELCKVAARKHLSLSQYWSTWEPPILLGHSKNGPFSILDGNHRLTAYAGSGQTGLKIPVIVGISDESCSWSIFDVEG